MRHAAIPVIITLTRRDWDDVFAAFVRAADLFEFHRWCPCLEDTGRVCDRCAASEDLADTWRVIALDLRCRLFARSGRITLVRSAATWREIARALHEVAAVWAVIPACGVTPVRSARWPPASAGGPDARPPAPTGRASQPFSPLAWTKCTSCSCPRFAVLSLSARRTGNGSTPCRTSAVRSPRT
ncbi:hypothetical protein [Actinoallomurus acanthiterrae]